MDLDKIVSISGKPGLHRIVAETPSRFVVEDIANPKRKLSIGTNYQVSPLAKITIFTVEGEDPTIEDVMTKMLEYDGEVAMPDVKQTPQVIKTYFKEVIPNYDESRVYPSDFKKILKWFQILDKAQLLK